MSERDRTENWLLQVLEECTVRFKAGAKLHHMTLEQKRQFINDFHECGNVECSACYGRK